MSTVIDSLIVRLGLDSGSLESKAPASGKKLKDLEEQGKKTGASVKQIGTEAKESSAGLETLAGSVGKLFAILGSGLALKQFVQDQIEMNAALGRLSKNLGMQVSTVSAWGNAVEELGGTAQGLQGTLDMLSKSQTELRLTGQSSLIPYLSALGVSLATVSGAARPVDAILLDLADRFSHMDRTTANNMGRMMGIDQGTMNLLLMGRKELELTIARQKQYNAVSKEQAETAAKQQKALVDLRQKFEALGRNLLQTAAPAIEKVLGWLDKLATWATQNSEVVGAALKMIAGGLALMGIAALPLDGLVLSVAALAAGILLLWQDYQTWKRGGDSLIDWAKWEPGITAATKGLEVLGKVAEKTFGFLGRIAGIGRNLANGNTGAAALGVGSMFGVNPNDPKNVAAASQFNSSQTGTQKQIQKYFMGRGWTAEQAAGIAANLWAESGGRTNATGDHGSAYGVAQWHPDRQAAFAQMFGHNIRLSNLDEQLAFVQHELTQGDRRNAGNALRGAKTAGQAGDIVSRLYESPRDVTGEASRRSTLAQSIMGINGAAAPLSAAGNGGVAAGGTTDASVTNHVGTINVFPPSGDQNGLARGMDFLFTSQANAGLQ